MADFSSEQLNSPVPGRIVTSKTGAHKFAVACGQLLQWDDGSENAVRTDSGNFVRNAAWASRLVTTKFGATKWAIASECCEYPPDLDMEFVEQANWPPYGISKHIMVRVYSTNGCPDLNCANAILTRNTEGHWVGTVGGITIDAYLDSTPSIHVDGAIDTVMRFNAGGCVDPITITITTTNIHWDGGAYIGQYGNGKIFPFRGKQAGDLTASECCLTDNARVRLEFLGFCQRVRQARFVGWKNGRMKFAVGGCCLPCGFDADCCSLYQGAALRATITAGGNWWLPMGPAGDCSFTTVVDINQNESPPPVCPGFDRWQGFGVPPEDGGPCSSWILCLTCVPLTGLCSSGQPTTRWTMRMQNTQLACGCYVEQSIDVCNCDPLELEFGPLSCSVSNENSGCNIFVDSVVIHQ